MSDKDDAFDLDLFSGDKKKFRKVLASQYEFYLTGPIEAPSEYVEWFDVMRHATINDRIKVYINSTGGDLSTALQFMRVLSETDATVICSIEGYCMSAATMVFLCADAFEISPHSLFMMHNYSGGAIGKGGEIYDQVNFERGWSKEFLEEIYKDFLTKKEIKSLLENKDIWLSSNQVIERMQKLVKKRNKQE